MTASSRGWTPLFLNAEPSKHRRDRDVQGGRADRPAQLILGDRLVLEEGHHDLLVVVGDRLDQLVVVLLGLLLELVGDVALVPLGAQRVDVADGLHRHQVDMALEVVLGADRDLDRHRARSQPVDHRLHGVEEVGAHPVHLVDERDARNLVLVGLPPDRLGLRLDAGHGVEQGDGAVEHAQRALDLDGEVHVPGRVDDVDATVAPEAGGGGRRDRDAALLLLHHPVHRRGALVHLTHLVGAAGVVEDPLGGRRLAGVDVRHDADVPDLVQLIHLGHARPDCGFSKCHNSPYQR